MSLRAFRQMCGSKDLYGDAYDRQCEWETYVLDSCNILRPLERLNDLGTNG